MPLLTYILLFTFIGSILSLIGGILLIIKEKFTIKISHLLISFAAGTLLGATFFDLLPEALEIDTTDIFFWMLIGIIFFFLLERFIHWFHFHSDDSKDKTAVVPLIILGDSVHNFIDGVVIAATFLISIPLGITTAIAVGAHEIPQEIGDFGILLNKGLSKRKVILTNVFSALTSIAGAVMTFYFKDILQNSLAIFLSITAGFFLYIALSDLVPEIHNKLHDKRRSKFAFLETSLLFFGIFIIWFLVNLLEQ